MYKNKKKYSLKKILLEEESPFDILDTSEEDSNEQQVSNEEDSGEEVSSEEDSGEENSNEQQVSNEEDSGEEDSGEENSGEENSGEQSIDLDNFYKLAGSLNQNVNIRDVNLTSFGGVLESPYKKSLSKIIFENEDSSQMFNNFKDLIDKNSDLIDKGYMLQKQNEKGFNFDLENEVKKAFDVLINFENKVDKIELIADLFRMKIKKLAPVKKINDYIEEFNEKYYKLIDKNSKKSGNEYYDVDEYEISSNEKTKSAYGAMNRG